MINLCLVVIATQFSETKKREIERMKQERARFHSTSTLASGSMSDQLSCYAEIMKYVAHLYRKARARLKVRYLQLKRKWRGDRPPKRVSMRRRRRKRQYEVAQGPLIACGDVGPSSGGSIIVPSGSFTSGPVALCKHRGGPPPPPPPSVITPPEYLEPPELHVTAPAEFPNGASAAPLRRPVLLKIPSGGVAEALANADLLTPSPPGSTGGNSPRRRRSSVMFSDVVLLHGPIEDHDARNVCLSEKTTQTEPEEPLDPSLFLSSPPHRKGSSPPESKGSLTCGELLALSGALSAALPAHMGVDARSVQTLYSSLTKGVKHLSESSLFGPDAPPNGLSGGSSPTDSFSDSDWSEEEWSEEEEGSPSKITLGLLWVQGWVKKLVEHRYFRRGILLAILINTLSMGVEYHNQVRFFSS